VDIKSSRLPPRTEVTDGSIPHEWGSYLDSRNLSAAQSHSYCQKWQF
jgi:hypothetical protein